MKRLFLLLVPFITLTTGCTKTFELKYRKQIIEPEGFCTRVHNPDGSLVNARWRMWMDNNLHYEALYENYTTSYRTFTVDFLKQAAAFSFSYNYYYGPTKNPSIGKEKVDVVFYKVNKHLNEKGEQGYFVYGYNNPQIVFTNEKIDKNLIEKYRITVYAQDKDGKEISMKSYPVLPGYDLTLKFAKDAEWQRIEIV